MNRFRLFVVPVALLVLRAVPSTAQNFTYTQIPDLCCSGNRANGINSNGDIVGHYFDAGGLRHGYFFGSGSAAPVPIDFSTARFDLFMLRVLHDGYRVRGYLTLPEEGRRGAAVAHQVWVC